MHLLKVSSQATQDLAVARLQCLQLCLVHCNRLEGEGKREKGGLKMLGRECNGESRPTCSYLLQHRFNFPLLGQVLCSRPPGLVQALSNLLP